MHKKRCTHKDMVHPAADFLVVTAIILHKILFGNHGLLPLYLHLVDHR
jgi:hypothetical protein